MNHEKKILIHTDGSEGIASLSGGWYLSFLVLISDKYSLQLFQFQDREHDNLANTTNNMKISVLHYSYIQTTIT